MRAAWSLGQVHLAAGVGRPGTPRPAPRRRRRRSTPFAATDTPNSVPRSITLPCGDRTSNPIASAGTRAVSLPWRRRTLRAETRSRWAGPSRTTRAPHRKRTSASPRSMRDGPAGPQVAGRLAVRPGAVLGVDQPGDGLVRRRPRPEPAARRPEPSGQAATARAGRQPADARSPAGAAAAVGAGDRRAGPGRSASSTRSLAWRARSSNSRSVCSRMYRTNARRASASARSRASRSARPRRRRAAVQVVLDQRFERLGRSVSGSVIGSLSVRSAGQGAGDALEQGLPDPPQRVVHAVRRPVPAGGRGVHAGRVRVALGQQGPVGRAELLHAPAQGLPAVGQLVVGHLLVGLDQQQVQVVAEEPPLAGQAADEVGRLEPGHPARPGEEAPLAVELVELAPQDQGRLLVQVVGVVQVRDQGVDVPVQPGLVLGQVARELGLPVLDVLGRHRRPSRPPRSGRHHVYRPVRRRGRNADRCRFSPRPLHPAHHFSALLIPALETSADKWDRPPTVGVRFHRPSPVDVSSVHDGRAMHARDRAPAFTGTLPFVVPVILSRWETGPCPAPVRAAGRRSR